MAHLNYTIGGNSNLVSFKSAARVPVDSLKVHFKPIQEGTGDPSPENVRPITGWTGVEAYKTGINLIDEAFLSDPNNYVNVGGYGYYYTEDVRLSPNTKYRFVWSDYDDSKINSCNLYVSGANQYIISDGAYRQYPEGFTTNDSGIIRFGINHRSGYNNITEALSDIFKYGKLLLQVGTDETSYEPYIGQTIPVEFHGKNLLNVNAPEQAPSDISGGSSAKRIFAKNTRWPGIAYSNYYIPAYVTEYSVSNGVLSVTNNNVYGVGYALKLVPGQQYILSATSTDGRADYAFYAEDGTWLSAVQNKLGSPVTIPEGTDTTVVIFYSPTSGTNVTFSNIQLELGSTATAYEPYNNTFYGGYVDIAKGELVVDKTIYTITGEEEWDKTDYVRNPFRTAYSGTDNSEHNYASSTIDNMWCNKFAVVEATYHYLAEGAICVARSGTWVSILINSPSILGDTAESCKAVLREWYQNGDPLRIVATLKPESEQHYQLTPTELSTLLSTNNIWSNANDVTEVSYAVHDSAMIRAAKRRMAMAVSNPDFLPSSYRRLTGIIFDTKTYYLFNNFHLQGNDTVRISVSVNKSCNVFGCYSSGSAQDNYSLYATTSSSGKYLRYNGETYKSRWASTDQGQRYDIIITPTGSSGMPPSQDDTWEEKNFVSETELCVGTTAVSASSSKLDGIIYGNFIVDNRLCAVPVERISDGTVGYYERYTNTFYEPIGTNPEKLGYA